VTDETPSGLGTLLASKTPAGAINAGVRNQILFDTPVPVSAALYVNGMYATVYTANRYAATGGFFNAADVVSGPIRAYQHGGGVGSNGRFKTTATGAANSYPDGQFGGGGYWVSPIVSDVNPSAPVTHSATGNRTGTGSLTGAALRAAGATGNRTGTGSLIGAASGSFGVSGSLAATAHLVGAATVISDQAPSPTTNSAGWYSYLNIMSNNAAEMSRQANSPPVACPNDGEPLDTSVHGVLFCPFDGWEWSGLD
jgi:hypothetical protein